MKSGDIKPLIWIASSKKSLLAMPDEVQDVIGFALHQAQTGGKSDFAKPLKGFGSAGVLEIVEDWDGDTYRAVYTVRFANARVRPALLPEKIRQRQPHADAGHGQDSRTPESR